MLRVDVNKLDADTKVLVEAFQVSSKRMRDLSNFWRKSARPAIIEDVKEVFRSNGYGGWPKRKEPAPHRLLRKTLKLYNSWTKPGAQGNVERATKDTMVWGSSISYSKFHEEGTSRMPARPIASNLTRTNRGARRSLRRKLNESLSNYLFKHLRKK